MYEIGDLVFYESTGVCRIDDISTQDITGLDKDQLFYILHSVYGDCKIWVPVESTQLYMRRIITKERALRLIDMIPNIQAEAFHGSRMRELVEHYEDSLNSHNCRELIEMTMSIYAKKQEAEDQNKKFGAIDKRFMKQAEDLLFGELAAALEIPKEDVQNFIADRIVKIDVRMLDKRKKEDQ
ncbi:CarD family transcriptional regulator [Alkalibacter rhizosphaerae]|uniref:CarD family transcriptional regulator n=1 Tax=Alkalibacter rhizosphaerae TaxID=2815577 RepID=A0A975AHI5_9FIRM|nr:CarD family transcriptional regulator [Alkalibacter rhizosphaerae]QSX08048.1 CarD family transcriptional regulator [Alkalibacter rhizosphaerae]